MVLKKADVERWYIEKIGSWLNPIGFEWWKKTKTFERTHNGARQKIRLDVVKWPNGGVNVGLPLEVRIESLGAMLDRWRSTEEYKDRKSTRLNSSHLGISYAVFCLKKK